MELTEEENTPPRAVHLSRMPDAQLVTEYEHLRLMRGDPCLPRIENELGRRVRGAGRVEACGFVYTWCDHDGSLMRNLPGGPKQVKLRRRVSNEVGAVIRRGRRGER